MSTLQLALLITLNVFIICVTFLRAKSKGIAFHECMEKRARDDLEAARFAELEVNLPKSPYGVKRQISGTTWGYCITMNGEVMFDENKAQLFHHISTAIYEINKLERIEGYKQTRV